jgi:hypothetical protein
VPAAEGDGPLVAWVTSTDVPEPGPAWSALSSLHGQTGLVPVLLDGQADEAHYFYGQPADVAEIDRLDAVAFLAGRWEEYGRFPGLAPCSDGELSRAERDAVLASLPPARIGLVPAQRPADVPAIVGWSAFGLEPYPWVQVSSNAVWVAAVLRTFEDRFRATLLHLDQCSELHLLVDGPPGSLGHATRIAAELSVFGDEWGGGPGLREVSETAAALVGAPVWRFWWD